MELIYILSSAHSGSTILDLLLGANASFCSSGEQKYLPWQLERTALTGGSLEQQSVCTCLNSFRKCSFWSEVFKRIKKRTGVDIDKQPRKFPISFFGKFAYKDSGNLQQKVAGKMIRHLLQLDMMPRPLIQCSEHLQTVLHNNWILYETMAEVSGMPFVVDSSKDITRALLLHKDRPKNIVFLFLSRGSNGYVNSMMKRGASIEQAIKSRNNYLEMISQVKKYVKGLRYYEIKYESFINDPVLFLQKFSEFLNVPLDIDEKMKHGILNTHKMHLVAGNPTRYGGEMKLKLDEKWKRSLSEDQIKKIKRFSKTP